MQIGITFTARSGQFSYWQNKIESFMTVVSLQGRREIYLFTNNSFLEVTACLLVSLTSTQL